MRRGERQGKRKGVQTEKEERDEKWKQRRETDKTRNKERGCRNRGRER